jgi:flagellar hook-length control protein FliK
MSEQLLPIAQAPVKQGEPAKAAKGASASETSQIANGFMAMLQGMIPADVPEAAETASTTPLLPIADLVGNLKPLVTKSSVKPEGKDANQAQATKDETATDSPVTTELLGVLLGAQLNMAAALQDAATQTMKYMPISASNVRIPLESAFLGQAEPQSAHPQPAMSSMLIAPVKSGVLPAMSSVLIAPLKSGVLPAKSEPQTEIGTPIADMVKQLKPVAEELPAVEIPPLTHESQKEIPAVPPPATGTQERAAVQTQSKASTVEETIVAKALEIMDDTTTQKSATSPQIVSAPVTHSKTNQAFVSDVKPRETERTQKSAEKPAQKVVEKTATPEPMASKEPRVGTKLDLQESTQPKGAEQPRAETMPAQAVRELESSPVVKNAAAAQEFAPNLNRHVSRVEKESSDQQSLPSESAARTVLPQGSTVAQSQSGSSTGDAMTGKNFSAMVSQISGTRPSPVQQNEKVASEPSQALPAQLSQGVVDQVVKHISLQVEGKSSEMRLTLKPESLGDVVVQVRMDDGKMHAQIDVGQASVKTALESNLPQLRQALVERGIDVQRIDVFAAAQSSTQESNGGQGDRPRRHTGNRRNAEVDPVEQYQASRQMGYNTMEIIM